MLGCVGEEEQLLCLVSISYILAMMLTPFHFPALISFSIVCFFESSASFVFADTIDEVLDSVCGDSTNA